VIFDVENTTKEKLGLVITVNGVSTLYKEMGQPDQMTRWVLAPFGKHCIRGFYKEDRQTYNPIVGISEADSEALFEDLGGEQYAGLIHVYVFRHQEGAPTVSGALSVSRGSLRTAPPRQVKRRSPTTWAELQRHIATTMAARPGRGLMVAGFESRDEELKVEDLPAVNLTDTMVIRYYMPQRLASDTLVQP
jgi:hypothetical protein